MEALKADIIAWIIRQPVSLRYSYTICGKFDRVELWESGKVADLSRETVGGKE
jgi:DNA-binding transcriptional regulator/RsmH inhibitor MraZ